MAALDAFDRFLSSLAPEDRVQLDGYLKELREELFAARSEDARLRLVHEFMTEIRQQLKKKSHATAKT